MLTCDRRRFLWGSALSCVSPLSLAQAEPAAVDLQTHVFSTVNGVALSLDLYRPAGVSRALPVIVFIHGGAWMLGDRKAAPDLRRYFARSGFAMASIDYRLAPAITFPSNLEDVRTAVRWLRANAASLDLDPERIGLWGTSAGGHLASLAGLAPLDLYAGDQYADQSSAVRCVLDGYGPAALALQAEQLKQERAGLDPVPAAVEALPNPARGEAAGLIRMDPNTALLGAAIEDAPQKAKAASPITYASAKAPPFLIMHGLADRTVPHGQSVVLYEALARADADVTLRLVHGLPHTFFNLPGVDEAAGPYAMEVREHRPGGRESRRGDTARVFDVAHDFFKTHLT